MLFCLEDSLYQVIIIYLCMCVRAHTLRGQKRASYVLLWYCAYSFEAGIPLILRLSRLHWNLASPRDSPTSAPLRAGSTGICRVLFSGCSSSAQPSL